MIFTERIIAADGTETVIEQRSVEECRAAQLEQVRRACEEAILAAAPDYKQRNAALGLLTTAEEAEVVSTITTARTEYARCKSLIEAVAWDGTEGTRAACCDAIQAVRFDA